MKPLPLPSHPYFRYNSLMKNIEIKARAKDLNTIRNVIRQNDGTLEKTLHQTDTYFHVHTGRMKLRETDEDTAVLIQYNRVNSPEAKISNYTIYKTASAKELKTCLENALGVKVIVKKKRELYIIKSTRIHLDEVEDLGTFIELETVVADESKISDYGKENADLQSLLGIKKPDLIKVSYSDLLLNV